MKPTVNIRRGHWHLSGPIAILFLASVCFGLYYVYNRVMGPRGVPLPSATQTHLSRLDESFVLSGVVDSVEALPDSGQSSLNFTLRGKDAVYRVTPRSLNSPNPPYIQSGNQVRLRVSTFYENLVLQLENLSMR